MSIEFDRTDEAILHELRGLWAKVDPVPAGFGERVKYAMSVRLLEAEIAELTRLPELLSRGGEAEVIRSMSFTGSRLSLMVTITDEGDGRRVDGWVTRGGAYIELVSGEQTFAQTADEDGRFVIQGVPSGAAHVILWESADKNDNPTMTPTVDL